MPCCISQRYQVGTYDYQLFVRETIFNGTKILLIF